MAPTREGGLRPAVLLDRDGTLIEWVHYLVDPGDVRLVAGAAAALERLRAAGFARVVVTNQSALGRGMLDEAGLVRVHQALERQLAAEGASLDGIYWNGIVPGQDDPAVIEHPDRKPGPGMLQRAARELGLDLGRSWMIGDHESDLHAGANAGCAGSILVRTGHGERTLAAADGRALPKHHVSRDLPEAVAWLLARGEAG